jgi:hypothetical protein
LTPKEEEKKEVESPKNGEETPKNGEDKAEGKKFAPLIIIGVADDGKPAFQVGTQNKIFCVQLISQFLMSLGMEMQKEKDQSRIIQPKGSFRNGIRSFLGRSH